MLMTLFRCRIFRDEFNMDWGVVGDYVFLKYLIICMSFFIQHLKTKEGKGSKARPVTEKISSNFTCSPK